MPDKNANGEMTEEELARELKGSLLILSTSSAEKRDIYRRLFSLLGKERNGAAGLDLYFTDSGALGITPSKTAEKTGFYKGNLDEKAAQQIATLRASESKIRSNVFSQNGIDSKTINIMGMTEDHGWKMVFDDEAIERKFVDRIKEKFASKLRQQDRWIIEKLDKTGFPGPNFKPIVEHLEGGFNALVEMIYDVADELHIEKLKVCNELSVSFVSPKLEKKFEKSFKSYSTMLTRPEYAVRLSRIKRGEAIDPDFVHVPEGQAEGKRETFDMLMDRLYSAPSRELPASYTRRDLTEYLQGVIGKRKLTREQRDQEINIAMASPKIMGEGHSAFTLADRMMLPSRFHKTRLPGYVQLREYPGLQMLGDSDVVVLMPEKDPPEGNGLTTKPNLGLVLSFLVTTTTDPESMRVPIVLDNRTGLFDDALRLMSDASAQGRLLGKAPFYVANTKEELSRHLTQIKEVAQRSPLIRDVREEKKSSAPPIEKIPRDNTFTVFIGGGHNNNAKLDREEAQAFGYMCAQQGWRIVTGAGSVEGSMGGVHTGFIQFHLDKYKKSGARNQELKPYIKNEKYDAERIIVEQPSLIETLADNGRIPRDMFYGYSMQSLLDMESPSGKPPPGIKYFETANRVRRLDKLLSPGTKIFLPGSVGTDEEFEETIKQHLTARARKQQGVANDSMFSDGTPDDDGTIIIYNRKGHLDKLLGLYGLLGSDPIAQAKRNMYKVRVVTTMESLIKESKDRAKSWTERLVPTEQQSPARRA